jgi:hypothetical protein
MNLSFLCEQIVNKSPFLRESIAEDLVKISALARKIKPEVDVLMGKPVKEGAIIMAIKRMTPGPWAKISLKIPALMKDLGDFVVRSGLESISLANSDSLVTAQASFIQKVQELPNSFHLISNGLSGSTFVFNDALLDAFQETMKKEQMVIHLSGLAAVTVNLPDHSGGISGFYYYMLKSLAWEGINIIELISTSSECSLIVSMDDVDKTFSVLMRLKKG